MDANGRSQFGARSTIRLYNFVRRLPLDCLAVENSELHHKLLLGGFVLSWFVCLFLVDLTAPKLPSCSVGHWLVQQANAVPIRRSCKPSDQPREETFETFYPHASPTHTATARLQKEPKTPTVYRRANLTIYPSSSEASDWLSVTKASKVSSAAGTLASWELGKRGERVARR